MAQELLNDAVSHFITFTDSVGSVNRSIFKGNISALKVNSTLGTVTLNVNNEPSLTLTAATITPGEGQPDWSETVALLKSTLVTYILEYPFVTSPGSGADIVEFRSTDAVITLNNTHKTTTTTLGSTNAITVYVPKVTSYTPGQFAILNQYNIGQVTVIFADGVRTNNNVSSISTDGIGSSIRLTKIGTDLWNVEKLNTINLVLPLVQGDLFTVDASLTVVKLSPPTVASTLKHSGEASTSVFWDPDGE